MAWSRAKAGYSTPTRSGFGPEKKIPECKNQAEQQKLYPATKNQ